MGETIKIRNLPMVGVIVPNVERADVRAHTSTVLVQPSVEVC